MVCPKCGAEIPEDDLFCGKCGAKAEALSEETSPEEAGTEEISPKKEEKPENTVMWIILSAIQIFLCCSVPGIVSLVYAVNANSAQMAGRNDEIKGNIEKAQIWFLIGIGFSILIMILGNI
ncbi:MAG: CD225/dispanin family protein [Oscillospiraceae bacterium]|nr:CD225/dispanin family protein [Oscillospiraceae bacterium]